MSPIIHPLSNQTEWCDPMTGMEFIWIPAGSFMMGSPKEELGRFTNEAQHCVTIAQGFYLGKYLVTQAQWQAIMGDNPAYFKGDNLPVEQVNWLDVQHFINHLNDKTGQNYCLPTEAEWEYACRAGTMTPYYTGHSMTAQEANFNKNVGKTTRVGSYPPNPWGLYDMKGNVFEWTASVWNNSYQFSEQRANYNEINSVRAACAARGGSWWNDLESLRSASRGCCILTSRDYYFGFRLAKIVGNDKKEKVHEKHERHEK